MTSSEANLPTLAKILFAARKRPIWLDHMLTSFDNKSERCKQCVLAVCSKAEPNIFASLQTPSRGCRMAKI